MITLRNLVRMDTAIAGITGEECHFLAKVLLFVWAMHTKWYLGWLLPKEMRQEAFRMKMLAAVLGRTSKEREPKIGEQIRIAMEQDRKAQ